MHVCVCVFFNQCIFIIQSNGFCDVFNQVYHVLQSDLLITLSCDPFCWSPFPNKTVGVSLCLCIYVRVHACMPVHVCACKNLDYTYEQKRMCLSGPGFLLLLR